MRLRLSVEQPALAEARYPHLYTPEELQSQALGPNDYLIAFFLGKKRSITWVVGPKSVDWFPLPPRTQIEEAVRSFLDYVRNPGASVSPDGAALSQTLAREITARVPDGSRLVVVPDRALHYLPFEALSAGGRYLVERYPISYAPSASSYAFLRRLPPPPRHQQDFALAIGNPPHARKTAASERVLAVHELESLKPLAHAGEELTAISRLFRCRILEQEQAAEKELRGANLERAVIVHFATHGLLDERRPERSGLVLAARPPHDDGILQMREVYELPLRARLVTLSACRTALGKAFNGEGIVGLSRAFFYAGANSVMASLWSVNDASTAKWMATFYGQLRDGHNIDEAARAAKLSFMADSRLRHPYYWAPFIVTGNAGVAVHVPRSNRLPAAVPWVLATLLLPAAYIALRRIRNR
ncbi:MAG: CHAT domain-containing protein [Acidobacteriota bacterium]